MFDIYKKETSWMARKFATYKGYDTLNTYYSDSSLLSPDIFDISFFPNKLTVGKN